VLLDEQKTPAGAGRALPYNSGDEIPVPEPQSPARYPATATEPACCEAPPLPRNGQPSAIGGRVGSTAQPPAGGLASLDFTLAIPATEPLRFTTPRGSMEITAHNLSSDVLARVRDLAVVVVVALMAWAIAGMLGRGRLAWLGWLAGSWLLLLLGLLSIVAGIVPLAGVAAIVLASTLRVHRWATKRLPASS
jgi:hypothetical protein